MNSERATSKELSATSVLWLLLGFVVARIVAMYAFYLYDDAFITMRFAANLAEGKGFVYNPGEYVQGISTPLWGSLLALPAALQFNLETAAKLLNLVFDAAAFLLLVRVFRFEGWSRGGVFVLFLFGIDLYLAKTAVSGMEAPLFLLMTIAAIYLAQRRQMMWAALLSGGLVFVRPEGLLFALSLLGYVWWKSRRLPLAALLVGAAVIAAGAAGQFLYYGSWIPQSVLGKANLAWSLENFFGLALFPVRDPLQFILTIAAVFCLPIAWRRSEFVRIYSLWCFVLMVVWIISGAKLWAWYCYPVWFCKTLVVGFAIEHLLEARRTLSKLSWLSSPAVLSIATVGGWLLLAVVLGPSTVRENVQHKIKQWSEGNSFAGQSAYGMDFGAFGYYTGLRIIDEPGLVWPEAITKYDSDLRAILLGERPEYAFVTNYLNNVEVMREPELAKLYEPIQRFARSGDLRLMIPLDEVSQRWLHDFTLYERRELAPPFRHPVHGGR